MANNRLYLKCKRTGQMVMIAKYYPDRGWFVNNDELAKVLNEMFERDDFGNTADGNAHVLEYEVDHA